MLCLDVTVTVKVAPADYESDNEDGQGDFNIVKNPQTGLIGTRQYSGQGASTDILVASARAYVAAINRLLGADAPRRRKNANPLEG